ncbi:polysaccharide export protein [filamentous cyanobacterium CCP1]|nr:polysaccharide export protein [filamentous cyanobacterium CCP2]PSB65170.1 polysaccharide export protein [filamentous cyanobacterium CCP1]
MSNRLNLSKAFYAVTLSLVCISGSPLAALAQTVPSLDAETNPDLEVDIPPETVFETPQQLPSDYLLGPGDEVEITVFGYEEYTGRKVILPDGTISLSLIGSIEAEGQTTDELAEELTTQLETLLVNPVVTVNLTTLRPVVVQVSGEVMRPGPLQLSEGITLSAALVQSGGITQNADVRQVIIRRNAPNGEASTITVNLWDALSSDDAYANPILRSGDSVYIPRLTADATVDRRLLSQSSLAPQSVRVRVVGEVNSPGEIEVSPNSSISSAVAIAGGPTEDARLSQVAFVRMNESGQIERQVVDLRDLIDNYQVQEGDVVIVPRQRSSSFLNVASRFVINPLASVINLFLGIDRFVDSVNR